MTAAQKIFFLAVTLGFATYIYYLPSQAQASDFSEREARRREVAALEKIAASLSRMERGCK